LTTSALTSDGAAGSTIHGAAFNILVRFAYTIPTAPTIIDMAVAVAVSGVASAVPAWWRTSAAVDHHVAAIVHKTASLIAGPWLTFGAVIFAVLDRLARLTDSIATAISVVDLAVALTVAWLAHSVIAYRSSAVAVAGLMGFTELTNQVAALDWAVLWTNPAFVRLADAVAAFRGVRRCVDRAADDYDSYWDSQKDWH
jgi:hypothetical protein